jgi:hypothetical protein
MLTGVAEVSGLIWASWHYPITAVVYADAGLPAWFWLLTFAVVAAVFLAQAWWADGGVGPTSRHKVAQFRPRACDFASAREECRACG